MSFNDIFIMERNNGNIHLFALRNNFNPSQMKPETPAKKDIRTPFGLKSNDRMSSKSGSTQNVLLTEKYNRDIEMIRRMQGQGYFRKMTKKESLNLRKNNFLKDKEMVTTNTNQVNTI